MEYVYIAKISIIVIFIFQKKTDGSFIKNMREWERKCLYLCKWEREWVSEKTSQSKECGTKPKNTIDASLFGCGISKKAVTNYKIKKIKFNCVPKLFEHLQFSPSFSQCTYSNRSAFICFSLALSNPLLSFLHVYWNGCFILILLLMAKYYSNFCWWIKFFCVHLVWHRQQIELSFWFPIKFKNLK